MDNSVDFMGLYGQSLHFDWGICPPSTCLVYRHEVEAGILDMAGKITREHRSRERGGSEDYKTRLGAISGMAKLVNSILERFININLIHNCNYNTSTP